ncbi:MAG: crotonase/enoyl-CoA hydratase family protein [Acidimicrobiia bacterium]|nr:crotonase/enoyl-CoA hydratase family protein [Acidimicrobiia bacterium]
MSDRIQVTMEGGVADVRLNRPEKMNALDPGMFAALVDTADSLATDPSLRCVVLSGEGRAFCAGLDFASFQGMTEAGDGTDPTVEGQADDPDAFGAGSESPTPSLADADEGRITHRGQQAVYGWTSLPVPVIAAVHGHALGGGIQLALGADIRIVAPDAKLSILEIRWGLIPDMTGTQSLVDLVGLDVAKELTFTGRMVSGAEAVELGLCTQLADDPRTHALELAHEIAAKSPDAVRAAKRLFNQASRVSLAEGFAAERQEISRLIGSANQLEQVSAFFEKRAPNFADPT